MKKRGETIKVSTGKTAVVLIGGRLLERGTVLGDGCRRGNIVGVWGVGWDGGGEGNSVGRPLSGGDPMPDSFLAAR